jgi:hypothetical protein
MGYTHYWTQTKDSSLSNWMTVLDNVKKIIKAGKVPLANWEGTKGTSPELNMVMRRSTSPEYATSRRLGRSAPR